MSPLLKSALGALAVVIVIVIVRAQQAEAAADGWVSYGAAESQNYEIGAVEAARDQAKGTPAEPWLDFQLAAQLYQAGSPPDLERARQVAQDALDRFPTHPAADWFRRIVSATESLSHES